MGDELRKVNTGIVVTSTMIFAISLTLYVLFGQKDMLINQENSKYNEEELNEISVLASGIILVCVIIFLLLAIEQYEETKRQAEANFLFATFLSLIAQITRYTTLYNENNDNNIIEPEDVIP